jgi:hypothetical protein
MLKSLDFQLIILNSNPEIGQSSISHTPDLFLAEFTSIKSRGLNKDCFENENDDAYNDSNESDNGNDYNNCNSNDSNNNNNVNDHNNCNNNNNDENTDLYDMKGKRFLDAYLVNTTPPIEQNTDIHNHNSKKEPLKNNFFGFGLRGYNSQGESSDGEFDHSVGKLCANIMHLSIYKNLVCMHVWMDECICINVFIHSYIHIYKSIMHTHI